MHQRFGSQLLDDKNALEHGISIGRGGVWLTLNEEQYKKLMADEGRSHPDRDADVHLKQWHSIECRYLISCCGD